MKTKKEYKGWVVMYETGELFNFYLPNKKDMIKKLITSTTVNFEVKPAKLIIEI